MRKNKRFGVVITAYEQVELVRQNILNFRNNFSSEVIKRCPIVVVSTTNKIKESTGFEELAEIPELRPLTVLVLKNAPGNEGNLWEPPTQEYINWRHKFLPGRIFYSMQKGFNVLHDMGMNTGLHLHSDTFWKPNAELQLIKEIEQLEDGLLGIHDLCLEDNGNYAPIGTHVHPEGLLWNITECKKLGILDIFTCFNRDFRHYNWGSVESLIGCWYNYKLCGQNIMGPQDELSKRFSYYFESRMFRDYHGDWEHLTNLSGTQ